jgi:hypothetical protein
MNKLFFLFIILLITISLPLFYYSSSLSRESYVNLDLGKYPNSVNEVYLQNDYPITKKNGVSNKESSDIWWYKYIPPHIGSYEQITNNLKYRNNPDDGSCSRSEFCGTLYKDKQISSNIAKVLPPVKAKCGARVNYYYTPENLLTYRNITSILY